MSVYVDLSISLTTELIYIVLLYNVASHWSCKVLNYYGGGYRHPLLRTPLTKPCARQCLQTYFFLLAKKLEANYFILVLSPEGK